MLDFTALVWVTAAFFAANTAAFGPTYRAVSVMHTPVGIVYGQTAASVIQKNLRLYEHYITQGGNADIILFPESGTGFLQVPPPYLRLFCEVAPSVGFVQSACDDASIFGSTMPHAAWASCKAREYSIDIVINYCENTNVPDPVINGTRGYNINVAFTKDGVMQAKYRKSHITGTGPYLSQPSSPDSVVFNSSFGVKFGMFICYDFWFLNPMVEEMNQMGITDFLFPSEMASGPPLFLTAQGAAGWSLYHSVNVVASSSFGTGAAGSFHRGNTIALFQPLPYGLTDAHGIAVGEIPRILKAKRDWGQPKTILPSPVFSNDDQNKIPTKVLKYKGDQCQYGPPMNGLNFSFACTTFTPTPNQRFNLTATFNSAEGNSINCFASIVTASASKHHWVLGAIGLTANPTVATPSGMGNAFCMVFACDTPTTGCMSATPWVGWETDLRVTSVAVAGSFTGGAFQSNNTSLYPFFGLASGSNTGNTTDFVLHLPPAKEISMTVIPSKNLYTIGSNTQMSPQLGRYYFYSAGVYGTMLIGPG